MALAWDWCVDPSSPRRGATPRYDRSEVRASITSGIARRLSRLSKLGSKRGLDAELSASSALGTEPGPAAALFKAPSLPEDPAAEEAARTEGDSDASEAPEDEAPARTTSADDAFFAPPRSPEPTMEELFPPKPPPD